MTVYKWSQTPASNDTADSTINWREGMAPSQVNDSSRSMMAAIAKLRDDISGNIVTGGSSTAYTITTNQVFTALSSGTFIVARVHTTSGTAPTLNVDSTGAKAIASVYGTAIPDGALVGGGIYAFTYNATDTKWICHGRQGDTYVPGGTDVAIADGGTGASTAAAARTNLGVTATGADTTYAFRANNLSDLANAATAFSNIKQAASTAATGVVQLADATAMEARTAGRGVTADIQYRDPTHPKAWLCFNGGGTIAIRSDYGFASITDNGGNGDYGATMDTAMSSADYATTFGGYVPGAGSIALVGGSSTTTPTTTNIQLKTFGYNSGAANDLTYITVIVCGDH